MSSTQTARLITQNDVQEHLSASQSQDSRDVLSMEDRLYVLQNMYNARYIFMQNKGKDQLNGEAESILGLRGSGTSLLSCMFGLEYYLRGADIISTEDSGLLYGHVLDRDSDFLTFVALHSRIRPSVYIADRTSLVQNTEQIWYEAEQENIIRTAIDRGSRFIFTDSGRSPERFYTNQALPIWLDRILSKVHFVNWVRNSEDDDRDETDLGKSEANLPRWVHIEYATRDLTVPVLTELTEGRHSPITRPMPSLMYRVAHCFESYRAINSDGKGFVPSGFPTEYDIDLEELNSPSGLSSRASLAGFPKELYKVRPNNHTLGLDKSALVRHLLERDVLSKISRKQ